MGRANTSSVDTTKGEKLAKRMSQQTSTVKASFSPEEAAKQQQIINARKAVNDEAKKEKRKKNAKLAKAAKKKNKK